MNSTSEPAPAQSEETCWDDSLVYPLELRRVQTRERSEAEKEIKAAEDYEFD